MSRTSTEAARPRSDALFRRALAITVIVLVGACGLFLGLGYLQGPKLSSAQVDTTGVVEQAGQQLRLFANQAVATVDPNHVVVTPTTPFTVTTSGDVIAVQFDERLLYDTVYDVSVSGVTSLYAAQGSTLDYSFTTGTPQLYYLDRGQPLDTIVRTAVAGGQRAEVYSAAGIQSFVDFGKSLLVASIDGEGSALDLVSLTDAAGVQRIIVPASGYIERLQASTAGPIAGFTIADESLTAGDPLYWVDLESSGGAQPVLALDGAPLRVLDWRFVAGTQTILALSGDRSLLLIDPLAGTVVPLGQYLSLLSVTPDGSRAIVTDALGAVILTIADGSEQRLELPAIDADSQTFLGAMQQLPNGDVLSTAVIAPGYAPVVLRYDGSTTTVLYRTPGDEGGIQNFTVSPNGQYAAIETVPTVAVSTSDDYAADARSTSTTTVIIDIASGAQISSFTGFGLTW